MRRRSGTSSLPRPCPPLRGNRYAARARPREQTCRSAGTARRAEQARRGTDTPRTGARGTDAPGGLTGRRCGAEQMAADRRARRLACEEQTCRKAARRRRSGRRNRCATMLRAPPAERLRRKRAREEQTRRRAAEGSENRCAGERMGRARSFERAAVGRTNMPRNKCAAGARDVRRTERRNGYAAEQTCRGAGARNRCAARAAKAPSLPSPRRFAARGRVQREQMRRGTATPQSCTARGRFGVRNRYAASPRAGSPPRCGREPDVREQICRASAQASFSAWSRSARMSSICSMPIDRRT